MMTKDEHFMQLALHEAKKGLGKTSPNPCVGAVIVKNGEVIGSGFHEKAGTPHAEIHALRSAGVSVLGATMYVTLEPCCHTGRTPPCSHAVAESGICRVVIGMLDPNPLVDGGGKQYLIDKKISVTSGVLEDECRSINRPFIKHITTGQPLVVLKAGLSLDGKLNYHTGTSGWITGAQSVERVHHLRDQVDAIVVGRRTVTIDNPCLTTRLKNGGKDPLRVILDPQLQTPATAKVFTLFSPASTWVFYDGKCKSCETTMKKEAMESTGAKVIGIESDAKGLLRLEHLLSILGEHGLTSLLVEGGGRTHSSFLRQRLADVAYLFYAPIFAGSEGDSLISDLPVNTKKESIKLTNVKFSHLGEDLLIEGDIQYPC